MLRLRHFFRQELDQQLGQFDAETLLDFFSEQMVADDYSRGLHDAPVLSANQIENLPMRSSNPLNARASSHPFTSNA